MRLVADTNVLMSAFISDGTTRHLIRDLDADVHAPALLRDEVSKYDELIREKSGLSESELDALKRRLFRYVDFVDAETIEPHREEALDAVGDADADDAVFVATALAIGGTIWSDDSDLQTQHVAPVVTTSELIERTRR